MRREGDLPLSRYCDHFSMAGRLAVQQQCVVFGIVNEKTMFLGSAACDSRYWDASSVKDCLCNVFGYVTVDVDLDTVASTWQLLWVFGEGAEAWGWKHVNPWRPVLLCGLGCRLELPSLRSTTLTLSLEHHLQAHTLI